MSPLQNRISANDFRNTKIVASVCQFALDSRKHNLHVFSLRQCLNPFYCFQAFSCALWFADDYWMYASGIILISSFSLVVQVYEMRKVSSLFLLIRFPEEQAVHI